ncbi:unnamed protein product [Rotaria magnacalcarata]|uniref:EGF-like domain-containing protein n=1 Tax=Rotaria magnacalcarata TaxID=392030 RepID=A0A815MVH2_9BILA|nr:unnamed protein product [Rotaria magnacalcarata]CAF4028409.1 unnamed protein product [Rotaria magnacalcarata]
MKNEHPWKVQLYGDILCYLTLECDYGILCLDWRDVCDGIQQCMFGVDEENCDRLEFNECEQYEYRCSNGMCVPDEYFLDGDYDCLDWTDEKEIIYDDYCPLEKVSSACDDRMCPIKRWSCGDGQCIVDRLSFQKPPPTTAQCYNRRDSYHICETHHIDRLWTLPNGRCYEADKYQELNVYNDSHDQNCTYLLRCTVSRGAEKQCPCDGRNISCTAQMKKYCPALPIMYPNGGIFAPYAFIFYNLPEKWNHYEPAFIEFHGAIKCREQMVNINTTQRYSYEFNLRDIEIWLCKDALGTVRLNNKGYDKFCHNNSRTFNNQSYHFVDVCNTSRECISAYRIRDGIRNCVDKIDEFQNEIVAKTCSNIKRHRLRCSVEQPTCLSVGNLGNLIYNCKNNYDESWMGTGRIFLTMKCNIQLKDDCQTIRQYIEDSWTPNFANNFSLPVGLTRISYRAYCDTFWNFGSKIDENLTMCQQWWICPRNQWQCHTGQCIDARWVLDGECDCADTSDEEVIFAYNHTLLKRNLQIVPYSVLEERFKYLHKDQLASHICNIGTEFPCFRIDFSNPSENVTFNRPCIRLEQIGDRHIDCHGGIDERNTIEYCSRVVMLGYDVKCSSSITCISYASLCNQRCPHKTDDAFWCNSRNHSSDCSLNFENFVCLNGTCIKNGRCNGIAECTYGEDEYLCDPRKCSGSSLRRESKEFASITNKKKLYLTPFPNSINTSGSTDSSDHVASDVLQNEIATSDVLLSSTPYWCNRGVGVQIQNGSTVCFCSPHYYGDKCQFHNDRVTVILHLKFSQPENTGHSDSMNLLKILVLFLLQNQILDSHELHVRPTFETNVLNKKIVQLLYSRSPEFLRYRKARYLNRSAITNEHPYSVRIEAYERQVDGDLSLFGVWRYQLYFDYLPVFRLAKVLRFTKTTRDQSPCSSNPCNPNQLCQQLLNEKSQYVCLCKPNYTGENCSILDRNCSNGYCSPKALCKPNYRGLLTGHNLPYCICPFNHYGPQCEIIYDACAANPCQNDDSCFPASQPDRTICLFNDRYIVKNDKLKGSNTKLYINESVKHEGAVVQYFDIDLATFDLILLYQRVFSALPALLQYSNDQKMAPSIILVKLYQSNPNAYSQIYLISFHVNTTSIYGTIAINERNRCIDVLTLIQSEEGNSHSWISHRKYFC